MINEYIRNNTMNLTILMYIILMTFIIYLKPRILFNKDGTLKPFGIGYKNKSVLPLWLVSIIIAIFSSFTIMIYKTCNLQGTF